jgi:Ca2+-binding RTX toxin-like protein
MSIIGTAGNDTLTGTASADTFTMTQGGNDTVSGLGGNDVFNFGSTFDSFDHIDGGAGVDTLKLSGDYSSGLSIHSGVLTGVEGIQVTAGSSYHLVLLDGNIAAGAVLKVNGSALGAGDTLDFDANTTTTGSVFLIGGAGNDSLDGGAGNDTIHGGDGNDSLTVTAGHDTFDGGDGDDTFSIEGGTARITGGNGDDTTYFDAPFSKFDAFNGGAGHDTLVFESGTGSLTAVFTAATFTGVETLLFEDAGDVNVRTVDANVAAGQQLFVRADALAAGTSFRFNGSAETNGSFSVLGDNGANVVAGGAGDDFINLANGSSSTGGGVDVIAGGAGNDFITVATLFNGHDRFDGGTGSDTVNFDVGSATPIHFLDTTFTSIDSFFIDTGASGDSFFSADGNIATGKTLIVDGSELGGAQFFKFNGSAETDGKFQFVGSSGNDTLIGGGGADKFFGGLGQDAMTGNGGNDVFVYTGAAESTGAGRDVVTGFDADHDKFDLGNAVTSVGAAIAAGKLSTTTFDTDLTHVFDAAHLAAGGAVLFTPSTGTLTGHTFLVVDGNGMAGYQAGEDYVVELATPAHLTDLATGNFI